MTTATQSELSYAVNVPIKVNKLTWIWFGKTAKQKTKNKIERKEKKPVSLSILHQ